GMTVLYAMLIGYCILTAIGYGAYGLGDKIPAMTALVIAVLAFIMTIIKTNSYLFGFTEYEMLMALPFTEKEIVGGKFLYMYIKSLPWHLSIAFSMLVSYGIFVRPAWYIYPIWCVLSFFLPLIPMLLASLLGFVIARIGVAFKHWKLVQTVLSFAVVILSICSRFFFEKLFRTTEVADIMTGMSDFTDKVGKIYLPLAWFEESIVQTRISGMMLLIGVSLLLFEGVFYLYSRSYKKINSKMKVGVSGHAFKMTKQRKRSKVVAIANKEMHRFFGSTVYLVNMSIGYIFAIVAGAVSLVVGLDKMVSMVTQGAPLTTEMMAPAIPFVAYFLTGMMALTCSSPSLEGKNYWIIKSSPLTPQQIYHGKILANLYISIPAQLFATVCMCISARVSFGMTICQILLGIILCLFSATFGCQCGLRFLKLEWQNEVEVVKQGAAVVVYMFPNMILSCIWLVGSVILAKFAGAFTTIISACIFYGILTLIAYARVLSLAKKC
ncbi:MAG: hypothetical protein IK078_00225, partial [Lachnospiraceae bacterium]|nr:hypothetical protein [Lachnospiraceae bacterium]